ncbi:MAG: serine/threonine protein kinase [Muribaculaceae bacterium]|nr:serine/threonine protein kinase [Muribaculaceae bacterium]
MRETSEFTHTELDSVDFSDIDLIPVESKSTISDVFKVRINGKWHFLKRPKKEFSTHPVFISAIKKEFDIGYSLNHSGISRYESVGNDSQGIYLLSEWVDGFTLEDFIRKNPDYFKDATNRRKFVTQICSALSYLHGRQVLHLDLKPSNIMITKINHDVKLIDLGFAYSDCYQFETSGKSEAYAAPEQLAEGGEINELTDIYSLGLVLEYALTGRTDEEAMKLLPRQWSRAVARCRNENPADRPRSVDEVMNIVLKSRMPLFGGQHWSLSFCLSPVHCCCRKIKMGQWCKFSHKQLPYVRLPMILR